MREIERRVEKVEAAITECGIPKDERLQVIKGKMTSIGFVPDKPGDSVEARKQGLINRYGNSEGVIFVTLIDSCGS